MNGLELLMKMDLADPVFVEAADRKPEKKRKYWIPAAVVAACLCVVVTALLFTLQSQPGIVLPLTKPAPTTEPAIWAPTEPVATYDWDVQYNNVSSYTSGSKRYIPGYFTQLLTDNQLEDVLPEPFDGFGYAGFDGEGNLQDVYLTIVADSVVNVALGDCRDYVFDGEPKLSACGTVQYAVYRLEDDNEILYVAEGEINGILCSFTLTTDREGEERARTLLEYILWVYAHAENTPDLSSIVAEEIPEWFDKQLTYPQALEDPDYGAYMAKAIPEGFTVESLRRYKDQNQDYLSCLWTKGYSELQWKIYRLEEADKVRLTHVEDVKNYALYLYPIPRARSVPEELRQIVDNPIFYAEELTMDAVCARAYETGDKGDADGWRLTFSVLYGDTVVEVRGKGVDPVWIYEQLKSIL